VFICIRACDLKGIKNNTNQVLSRIMIIDQEAFQMVGYCNFVILLVCSGAHFEREISMLSTKILEPSLNFFCIVRWKVFFLDLLRGIQYWKPRSGEFAGR